MSNVATKTKVSNKVSNTPKDSIIETNEVITKEDVEIFYHLKQNVDVDQLRQQVKDINSLIKAVAPPKVVTQTVLDRRNLNKLIKEDRMSFSQIFKSVKKVLLMQPNEVTENSLVAAVELLQCSLKDLLMTYATDSLKEAVTKETKEFYPERLILLLSNINTFAKVGLTPKQYEVFKSGNNKAYNGTFIVDALLKGCTIAPKLYTELTK